MHVNPALFSGIDLNQLGRTCQLPDRMIFSRLPLGRMLTIDGSAGRAPEPAVWPGVSIAEKARTARVRNLSGTSMKSG